MIKENNNMSFVIVKKETILNDLDDRDSVNFETCDDYWGVDED